MTKMKRTGRPVPIFVWRFDKSRRLVVGMLLCVAALAWIGRGELQKLGTLWPLRQLPGPVAAVVGGGEEEAVPVLAPASVRILSAADSAASSEAVDASEPVDLEADSAESVPRGHPFDLLLMDRERDRSREAERWQAVIRDGSRTAAEQDEASRRLDVLWADSRLETEVEHLLAAQGYRAIATASGGRLQVVVDDVLDADAASRIGELIVRSTGVVRDAVTIVDSFSSGG